MTQTRMRQLLIAVAALIVVALAGVGLAAALRSPDPGTAAPGATDVPTQSATAAPGDDATADPSGAPSTDDDDSDDKFYGEPVTDSAEGKDGAEFESGLGVRILTVKKVELDGDGIGSVSGPGVAVTIELSNDTGKKASLGAVVVNAYTGDDRTPATPVESDDGFAGSIAQGATKAGTYTFGAPANETLYVTVSTSATSGVVVLEYR